MSFESTSCFQSRPLCSWANSRVRSFDGAYALHCNEKRLVRGEADLGEFGDLIAQVVLQLLEVPVPYGRTP